MTIRRLESISITDFRSIGGQITVPLDAQVVLIHGPNGAGKTSILSALELALAGSIDAMRRVDSQYLEHLVHRGAKRAEITVTARSSEQDPPQSWEFSSDHPEWARDGVLGGADANYYSERSYLAQATLGRLLEIYEASEPNQESALTRFVNDVLGLDSLEALIEGLHDAGDIRNTRHLVPELAALDREIAATVRDEEVKKEGTGNLRKELEAIDLDVRSQLPRLNVDMNQSLSAAITQALHEANSHVDETALTDLTRHRRELDDMVRRLGEAQQTPAGIDVISLEEHAAAQATVAAKWNASFGAQIEGVLDEARTEFPDLASIVETNPSEALEEGFARIQLELERSSEALLADDRRVSRQSEVNQSLEQAQARLAIIDEQIAAEIVGAAEIARILAELVPHLHDNECVVCGRDYSEVSTEPLSAQVARRAARFGDQAERLAALTPARSEAGLDLASATEETTALRSQLLDSSAKVALISRAARLQTWISQLSTHRDNATLGTQLVRDNGEARRALASARNSADVWTELRTGAAQLCLVLALPEPGDVEPIQQVLDRVAEDIKSQASAFEERVSLRRTIAEIDRNRRQVIEDLARESGAYEFAKDRVKALSAKRSSLEEKRDLARLILRTATETQQSIVRSVFNDSLNNIWRDLFVRLAPNEPFVPAFHVSDMERGTSPHLITAHRGGGNGGSPGAMLSAGNLNTAALTLFLALHLSTSDRLPFLVLDDPVQSMDDVHISQLAALLRTLTKQHDRQIVVAVHERALFDYLALELSPAFDGDRLITVELKKQVDGTTIAEPTYHLWKDDPVRASA